VTQDGPPPRHLHPVDVEPPFDPEYDNPARTPSHDRAAEQALLNALLTIPEAATKLHGELDSDDFYRPEHGTIWHAWHHLHTTDGVPPDAVTLNGHLLQTRETRATEALINIITAPANPALIDQYVTLIRDHARIRAAQHAHTKLGQQLTNATPSTIDQALGDALDTIEQATLRFGRTTTGPTQWAPLNLEAVLNGEEIDPPPAHLARTDGQHLLYTGAVHTISGEPGSGKTWLTLIAALQELHNGNTVTMVDFEDRASRVIGRLLALGARPQQIRDHFRYIRPHTALNPQARTDLEHATRDATLVILDGVTEAMTLHGLDLNGNADVATFYALLPRWLADQGAAVALIDHVVKDGEKQGRWAIGGQHKLAGIDGVAYLVQAIEKFGRGKTGIARITVSKDRPGYVEEIALGRTVAQLHLDATDINCLRHRLDPPTETPTDQAGNMRPTHLMEKVSRWLELTPGASRTQIETGVSGKVTYLRRAIDRLVQEGYVEVHPGPRNTQQHRVITPFREHDEEPQERLYD